MQGTTEILQQCCQLLLHSANCLAAQRVSAQLEPAPSVSRTQEALTEGTTTTASTLEKHSLSSSQQPAILSCITVSIALPLTSVRRGSSDTGTSPLMCSVQCVLPYAHTHLNHLGITETHKTKGLSPRENEILAPLFSLPLYLQF